MRLTIKLNLNVLVATSFTDTFYFDFDNITNMQNWYDEDENVTGLEFQKASAYLVMYVFVDGGTNPSYDERDGDIVNLSSDSNSITFTCDISNSSYARLMDFIDKGIIEVSQCGNTTIFAYLQNSENDALSKNLTFVDAFDGKFNHSIALKVIDIDVRYFTRNYNYVYVSSLARYYYVDSVEMISADITRLHLKEDVLMSWKDLIKQQSGLVTRSNTLYNDNLIDERKPLKDAVSIANVTLERPTTNYINFSFDFTLQNRVVTTYGVDTSQLVNYDIPTPITGKSLPSIKARKPRNCHYYIVDNANYESLCRACLKDDATASYIKSVVYYPFNIDNQDVFEAYGDYLMWVNNKWLGVTGEFTDQSLPNDPKFHEILVGASPYLIIEDFTLRKYFNDFRGLDPYTIYELYIPFVGWYKLDANKLFDHRLIVYYSIDIETGIATAFIFDYTTNQQIYSTTCEIGLKMDLPTSNHLEITKQKQANDLNMIMSMFTGSVTTIVGANTGKANAVAGGLMSIPKAIAQNVNANNLLFERAQTTFGTSDNAMHAKNSVSLRVTYHEEVQSDNTIFYHMQGKPSNWYTAFISLTGYTEIGEIHFDPMGNAIYQDEISEIVQLLHNGVIM